MWAILESDSNCDQMEEELKSHSTHAGSLSIPGSELGSMVGSTHELSGTTTAARSGGDKASTLPPPGMGSAGSPGITGITVKLFR